MKKVRLFNITDVETPALKEKGQANTPVAGRDFCVLPGESCEVLLTPTNMPAIQHAVAGGLLAVDDLPAAYVLAKHKPVRRRRKR